MSTAAKTFKKQISSGLKITAYLLLACFALTGCMGGTATSRPPSIGPTVEQGDPDIIRRGDKLFIRLSGVPDPDVGVYEEQVRDDGTISMPLIGNFKAAGKTLGQLKVEIENAYRDRKFYATPNITISQQERFVNVLGEVRAPQRVVFTNDLTILKAVTACGGFTDYAQKRQVKLSRSGKIYYFNAVEALQDPGKDIPLQAGDQIQVPRTIF